MVRDFSGRSVVTEKNYPLLGEEGIDQNYDGVCIWPVGCKVGVQRKGLGALRMRRRERRYELDKGELLESVGRGAQTSRCPGGCNVHRRQFRVNWLQEL